MINLDHKESYTTIKKTINYAKKDGLARDAANAPILMALSPKNKHHAMTALANLDKFTRCYNNLMP